MNDWYSRWDRDVFPIYFRGSTWSWNANASPRGKLPARPELRASYPRGAVRRPTRSTAVYLDGLRRRARS